jgi:hypothetical protein
MLAISTIIFLSSSAHKENIRFFTFFDDLILVTKNLANNEVIVEHNNKKIHYSSSTFMLRNLHSLCQNNWIFLLLENEIVPKDTLAELSFIFTYNLQDKYNIYNFNILPAESTRRSIWQKRCTHQSRLYNSNHTIIDISSMQALTKQDSLMYTLNCPIIQLT